MSNEEITVSEPYYESEICFEVNLYNPVNEDTMMWVWDNGGVDSAAEWSVRDEADQAITDMTEKEQTLIVNMLNNETGEFREFNYLIEDPDIKASADISLDYYYGGSTANFDVVLDTEAMPKHLGLNSDWEFHSIEDSDNFEQAMLDRFNVDGINETNYEYVHENCSITIDDDWDNPLRRLDNAQTMLSGARNLGKRLVPDIEGREEAFDPADPSHYDFHDSNDLTADAEREQLEYEENLVDYFIKAGYSILKTNEQAFSEDHAVELDISRFGREAVIKEFIDLQRNHWHWVIDWDKDLLVKRESATEAQCKEFDDYFQQLIDALLICDRKVVTAWGFVQDEDRFIDAFNQKEDKLDHMVIMQANGYVLKGDRLITDRNSTAYDADISKAIRDNFLRNSVNVSKRWNNKLASIGLSYLIKDEPQLIQQVTDTSAVYGLYTDDGHVPSADVTQLHIMEYLANNLERLSEEKPEYKGTAFKFTMKADALYYEAA